MNIDNVKTNNLQVSISTASQVRHDYTKITQLVTKISYGAQNTAILFTEILKTTYLVCVKQA